MPLLRTRATWPNSGLDLSRQATLDKEFTILIQKDTFDGPKLGIKDQRGRDVTLVDGKGEGVFSLKDRQLYDSKGNALVIVANDFFAGNSLNWFDMNGFAVKNSMLQVEAQHVCNKETGEPVLTLELSVRQSNQKNAKGKYCSLRPSLSRRIRHSITLIMLTFHI